MNLRQHLDIQPILQRLEASMLDDIRDEGPHNYTPAEVKSCMSILDDFLSKMDLAASPPEGLAIVEKSVLALNNLNESCGHSLIKTDQREDIVELMILAGHLKGFNERHEDITEDWRDW